MSRIQEALLRNQGKVTPLQDAANDEVFKSAWPELEPERGVDHLEPERGVDHAPGPSNYSLSSKWREKFSGPNADPVLIEQFRRLAATLHQAKQVHALKSVMVTSAAPGDGKTLTVCNLAYVLAESYRYRVLLIDADLRRPSIATMMDMPNGSGLVDALRDGKPQKLSLVQLTPRLTLLPAGRPTDNSIEALVSPRMRHILEEASSKFDWIILDAPPVGASSDARLLSQMVGGTLFVIRAGKTQHAVVQRGIDAVGRDQILGIVLNDVEVGDTHAYYYLGTETNDKR